MIRPIRYREIGRLLADGAQVADVLPRREFQSAHIKGALNLPLRNLMKDAAHLLDRRRPVIVYCRDSL